VAKKDDKSNSKQKAERRFSQEQYEMLLRCSEKKDMTEWNEWRKKNRDKDIELEGKHFVGEFYLKGADLHGAHLKNATFIKANMQGSDLRLAILKGADMYRAHLEGANFDHTELSNTIFSTAYLNGALVSSAVLENAGFGGAHLNNANFSYSVLKGAYFDEAFLQGAVFEQAVVDGVTSFWNCKVDRKTDFRGVALNSVQIDPATKQLLEYNIRRMNWVKWYKEHWFWRWPVQLFWWMSDYGMSTLRVVGVFFLLAFLFAGIYMNCAYWRPPGIIHNMIVEPAIEQEMSAVYYFWLALVRPVYFSIVTMTTLGFGDMYASKGSIAGHVILCVQVILGYVLLGALITRFAVLFTAGGPAGKFEEQKKKVDSVSGDNGIRGQASTE
jgi:hypothetical protein